MSHLEVRRSQSRQRLGTGRDTSPISGEIGYGAKSSRWFAILCSVLIVTISGCNKTPQEAVLGRWYNGDMSLRFRPNGTVVWNTQQGMAQGRYVFVGTVPRWATENTTVRVRLDVMRNGQAIQPMLDLQFVGGDRLRVNPAAQAQTQATNRLQAVLRRAQTESETAKASAIPAPSNRATTGLRGIR